MKRLGVVLLWAGLLAACGGNEGAGTDEGLSIDNQTSDLTGCNGIASSSVPPDGNYYLTTFGGGSDSGTMSCGSNTSYGSWYYAASRQRYGCGAHLKIEANGKCVVAQADDYGPDVCVENAAGGPIMDVSPLVSRELFGTNSAGWSDHFGVHVTQVDASTALGPCQGGGGSTGFDGAAAVSRAESWVQAGLLYCQAVYQGWDPVCGYTCNRTSNPDWNAYRSDCSGLISYAWGLPPPGRVTTQFAPFRTDASYVIDAGSLAPGDALNTSEHIILFKGWVTAGKRAQFIEEYDCGAPAHEFTSDVSVSGSSLYIYYKGYTYTAIRYSGAGGGGGGGTGSCGVASDGKLYCTNTAGAAMHSSATLSSSVVNHLRTSYSWFSCWGTGDLHAGGNTTWYYTQGDDNASWGWVPAVDLNTTSAFDADPSAKGLARCGSSPPPASSCSVHGDGKLYCSNTSGAAIYASAYFSTSIVDHLRTNPSWFDCWSKGDLHAGGNTTWYHTQGDDSGAWGYVPAVNVNTTSAFDADPSAQGLRQCTAPVPGNCSVHGDGRLYCTNTAGAAMYASPYFASGVVNYLHTSYSWFDCWGRGDGHSGGNSTWYHTLGDDNASWGWVPAVNLSTSSAFDADPSAQGLRQCASSPPPTSGCSVRSDGRLYCGNAAGASIYGSPHVASGVVNHLRTTFSWFDCWSTGDQHSGGNSTWYHTLGDDNGNWGFVPAVNLNTSSSFDANPSALGLPRCGS